MGRRGRLRGQSEAGGWAGGAGSGDTVRLVDGQAGPGQAVDHPRPAPSSQPRLILPRKDASEPGASTGRPTNQHQALDLEHHPSARRNSLPRWPPRLQEIRPHVSAAGETGEIYSKPKRSVSAVWASQTQPGSSSLHWRGNQGTGGGPARDPQCHVCLRPHTQGSILGVLGSPAAPRLGVFSRWST